MIEPIVIKVTDKVPELVSKPTEGITCANSDYTVVWQLDEEWAQFESRTMQVNYKDGTYERVLFTGDTCALPAIPVKDWFYIGLFAGDIHTTRPVKLFANRAITTDSGEERDPMPNGYAQAIQALDAKLDKNQGAENAGKAMVVDAEGNVVPGKAQGSSLPAMSADTKGKMLTNDGEKAEWGEVPKEVMVVNFTQDDDGNWSADKNWDDVYAVVEAGGVAYATENHVERLSLEVVFNQMMIFTCVSMGTPDSEEYRWFKLSFLWPLNGAIDRVVDSTTSTPVSYGFPQDLDSNQQAQARENIGLTPVAKTDAMTQSVGLDAETGELYTAPASGDNTLGITSATVGQIAKITAVDDSGKPTAWEAVDMAGGGNEWELIIDQTIESDIAAFQANTDLNGNAFNLKDAIILIDGTGNEEVETMRFLCSTDSDVGIFWGSGADAFSIPSMNPKSAVVVHAVVQVCVRNNVLLPQIMRVRTTSGYQFLSSYDAYLSPNNLSCGFNASMLTNYHKIDQLVFRSYGTILLAGSRVRMWGIRS